MHLILFMQINRCGYSTHCLTEAFIFTKSRPCKKRTFRIRDSDGNLIFFVPFYIICNIHDKRHKTSHMSDRPGLFSLEVSSNSMTVDIHDCTDIHTFKFKKYFFVFIFFFKKYFLSIPCFSPPTTFSGSCIQIGITFIETVR
ncbi:unknown [Tannerella sp. CAG:51]|nr:unknown [Tannerella sp. CAG:51]